MNNFIQYFSLCHKKVNMSCSNYSKTKTNSVDINQTWEKSDNSMCTLFNVENLSLIVVILKS